MVTCFDPLKYTFKIGFIICYSSGINKDNHIAFFFPGLKCKWMVCTSAGPEKPDFGTSSSGGSHRHGVISSSVLQDVVIHGMCSKKKIMKCHFF